MRVGGVDVGAQRELLAPAPTQGIELVRQRGRHPDEPGGDEKEDQANTAHEQLGRLQWIIWAWPGVVATMGFDRWPVPGGPERRGSRARLGSAWCGPPSGRFER